MSLLLSSPQEERGTGSVVDRWTNVQGSRYRFSCPFFKPRGSSAEAGSSVTRRQETALNSVVNSQQGSRLRCCAAVGGYVSGLGLPISNKPSVVCIAYTPISSLARLRSFGENRYSKAAPTRPLLAFYFGWENGRARGAFGTVVHAFSANCLFPCCSSTVEYTPPVWCTQLVTYLKAASRSL